VERRLLRVIRGQDCRTGASAVGTADFNTGTSVTVKCAEGTGWEERPQEAGTSLLHDAPVHGSPRAGGCRRRTAGCQPRHVSSFLAHRRSARWQSHALGRSLSAGGSHTCGITTSGAAYCWGYGSYGALGTGTTASASAPVAVSGGLTFAKVSAGGAHTCGVTTLGVVYCWGSRGSGRLGDGLADYAPSPQPVAGGLTFRPAAVP